MTRSLLMPLIPLYAAGLAIKNVAYDHGILKAKQLKWPVISVGNISVGGSGKTPFVIALSKLLKRHGMHVDVLSRGYGRSSDAVERVDPAGNAQQFGDEPLLIAQAADVPVYVGASRYEAGLLAEAENRGPGIHLLDDGFQHRKLARAVDIVLVHRNDFEETLLPAGRLRESLHALRRADVLVLREEDSDLEAKLRQHGIGKKLWRIARSISIPENVRKIMAFCGIARADEFFRMLGQHQVDIVATRAFRDHHRYGEHDMRQLIRQAQAHSVGTFLTTEKDFIRLSAEQKKMLSSVATLKTTRLEVHFSDEAAVMRDLGTLLPSGFPHLL